MNVIGFKKMHVGESFEDFHERRRKTNKRKRLKKKLGNQKQLNRQANNG